MKKLQLTFTMLFMLGITAIAHAQLPTHTLSGEISGITRNLVNDTVYLLSGFVYVEDGATLNIEPGTIIRGEKDTKGSLIITRGSKINALGTVDQPIVFTSNEPEGARNYGDWGGLIILGDAPINVPGGIAVIEGGVDTPEGDGTYGGANAADNSGSLIYVRIEYPGIPFVAGNEINGLTCGGVGSGTVIDHVMVSRSGDDAFEFFGGTVNAKYLIAHNMQFDINVLGAELLRLNVTPAKEATKVCTMKEGTNYCKIPSFRGYKWPTLTELHTKLFGEGFEGAGGAAG